MKKNTKTNKIIKNTFPTGHTASDFKCFGPIATKDGVFSGTMLCDLGCFNEQGKSSNKFYFGCVTQSTINNSWFAYFEYGKTGVNTVGFQFVGADSKEEAQQEYEKQLHSKNDKRGVWVNHRALGDILQAKAGKDCYLVRPLTGRNVGLPNACDIGLVSTASLAPVAGKQMDKQSSELLNDLNIAASEYTRSSMVGNSIPAKDSIVQGRLILKTATDLINNGADKKEVEELTSILYSKIPKKKNKGDDWVLSKDNIQAWSDDLDAFETALLGDSKAKKVGDTPFFLEYIHVNSDIGQFISRWIPTATRNRHSYLKNDIKIINMWKITRDNIVDFKKKQKAITKDSIETPLHQIPRIDLDKTEQSEYNTSGTALLFHGTRSVNVGGILRESLKMPAQLRGVSINGKVFGAGLYHADDWKKSAGYTSLDNSYWSKGDGKISKRKAFMFLTDVALGNPYVAPRVGDYSSVVDNKKYHSVYGKSGHSGVENNEFIVFDTNQNYLRYLVEFSA